MRIARSTACAARLSLVAAFFALPSWSFAAQGNPLHEPKETHAVPEDAAPVVLLTDGEPAATIVVADSDNKKIRRRLSFAARELQSLLEQASGAKLPVVNAKDFEGGPAIFLGVSEASKTAGFPEIDLPAEHFRVMTKGDSLAILGNSSEGATIPGANGEPVSAQSNFFTNRGTLFGVYDVLERFLGVRFYFPGELGTIVPKRDTVSIPPADYVDGPVLKRRTVYPSQFKPDGSNKGTSFRWRWRYGNSAGMQGNHTHNGWGKLYKESKPDIFLVKKNGKRDLGGSFGGAHLCYSHPDVADMEVEHMKRFYETGWREAWGKWVMYPHDAHVAVFPQDCLPDCQCEKCQALIQSYNGPFSKLARQSELVHSHYVKVARKMKGLWPEKYLLFGAYAAYTLPPPPTVEYESNMVGEVCIMDGNSLFKEPGTRKFWHGVLTEYKRRTGNESYVWTYPVWSFTARVPAHFPRMIVDWHREVRDLIDGEFLCGVGRNWALDHLTMYFWFRAMWNPDFDVESALDEYHRLCYGPAAGRMRRFYDYMEDRWMDARWGAASNVRGTVTKSYNNLFTKTYPKHVREKIARMGEAALAAAPEGTPYAARVQAVVEAHRPFQKTAELFERLDRGAIFYVQPGTPAAVDGKLDDACWRIDPATMVTNFDKPAGLATRVRFVYDDTAIYVAVRAEEPNMDALKEKAAGLDKMAWDDDGIEFFLAPVKDPDHYLQFAVNTAGAVFDGWKPAEAVFSAAKNFPNAQVGITKQDASWTLELSIPWSDMNTEAPKPGESRKANVMRNRFAGSKKVTRYYYSPHLGTSHHNANFYGTLIFIARDKWRETFSDVEEVKERWSASVWNAKDTPEAHAELTVADGVGRLSGRVGNSYYIALITARPNIEIRPGDRLEIRYRGPLDRSVGGQQRLQVGVRLKTPDGKAHTGTHYDNRKDQEGSPWRRLVVDPFALAKVKDAQRAELRHIQLHMKTAKGSKNAMEFDYVRVSPHTAATVK